MYPLQNVYIRKCKILKTPKFDITKLMEVHGDYTEEVGGALVHRGGLRWAWAAAQPVCRVAGLWWFGACVAPLLDRCCHP